MAMEAPELHEADMGDGNPTTVDLSRIFGKFKYKPPPRAQPAAAAANAGPSDENVPPPDGWRRKRTAHASILNSPEPSPGPAFKRAKATEAEAAGVSAVPPTEATAAATSLSQGGDESLLLDDLSQSQPQPAAQPTPGPRPPQRLRRLDQGGSFLAFSRGLSADRSSNGGGSGLTSAPRGSKPLGATGAKAASGSQETQGEGHVRNAQQRRVAAGAAAVTAKPRAALAGDRPGVGARKPRGPVLLGSDRDDDDGGSAGGGDAGEDTDDGDFAAGADDGMTDEERADHQLAALLGRVEAISNRLRKLLDEQKALMAEASQGGSDPAAGAGVPPPDTGRAQRRVLVSSGQVAAACGQAAAAALKGYQLLGINFLALLSRSGSVGGAILADEMGLGKTAQTVVFLGLLQHAAREAWRAAQEQAAAASAPGAPPAPCDGHPPRPHLVICPVSLIENWQRELKQWCPSLRVVCYYGKDREWLRDVLEEWQHRRKAAKRAQQAAANGAAAAAPADAHRRRRGSEDDDGSSEHSEESQGGDLDDEGLGFELCDPGSGEVAPFDVLITGYTMYERDSGEAKKDRAFISRWPWSHLVTDEAHALKNRNSVRVQKLMKLARACEHRIMLTGTPLQNDLGELLNLLRFLMPSLFANGDEALGEEDLLAQLPKDPQAQARMADRMRVILSPFIMRRLKSEVANQLTDKVHRLVEVDMVPEQAECYRQAVERLRAEAAGTAVPAVASGDAKAPSVASAGVAAASSRDTTTGGGRKTRRGTTFAATDSATTSAGAGGGKARGKTGRGPSGPAKGATECVDLTSPPASPSVSLSTTTTVNSPPVANALVGSGTAAAPAPVSADAVVAKLGAQKVGHIFTHLRKVAMHPLLVRRLVPDEAVVEMARLSAARGLFGAQATPDMAVAEMMRWSDHRLHDWAVEHSALLGKHRLPDSAVYASAKLRLLQELLPKLKAAGSRVLLFSQWTQMLDIMEWFLGLQGHSYVRLDGATQVAERQELVDRFNDPGEGIFVFLLSTRAGGQGLNLTGADTVVLHDVDFNPQVDRQAEDRCHRLGQTRTVTVYRLVVQGTVDRAIYDIAQRKLQLDAAIMEGVTLAGDGSAAAAPDDAAAVGLEDAEEAATGEAGGKGKKKGGKAGSKAAGASAETQHMGAILAALLKGQA